MCIAFLAVDRHPTYPLIVLANRDEALARPTRPLHRWSGEPAIYAGQDLVAGGSWMGVSERGRLALLTNYREPPEPRQEGASRGDLVRRYLAEEDADFSAFLKARGGEYAGFNLIFGPWNKLTHYSNRGSGGFSRLEPGLHGLSNALLDTPWPKVERGKAELALLLEQDEPDVGALFALLADETPASVGELPSTGVSPEIELRLSSIRIPSLGSSYGSVSASVLLVDREGRMKLWERQYDSGSEVRLSPERP